MTAPCAGLPRPPSSRHRLLDALPLLAALLPLAACGAPPAALPQNTAPAGPRVTIAPDEQLGWIGLAPIEKRGVIEWLPAADVAVLLPQPATEIFPRTTLLAIDSTGRRSRVLSGTPVRVPYGCDNNQLDVVPFGGPRLVPGLVWLLPEVPPETWDPDALAIASPAAAATAVRRRDTVGPLSLELERTDDTRGTLTILRGGRALLTLPIERAVMEGAPTIPLDLRYPGVGIPEPLAAWSVAEGGPILLVLSVPGYEGMNLQPILVEDAGARVLESMQEYLYRCAF
jgi:hypothetical protein